MESPVRICLGAALVVNLLLLCGTAVDGGTLPQETTTIALKDDRSPRLSQLNSTWPTRGKSKTPDISLNELSPKDSTSEEHTEKNAKYKDRGRVRFGSSIKSTTSSPLRRSRSSTSTSTTSTEASTLIIVTPTPEVKKPLQIIDSMRNYKKTKMPSSTSSTTPLSVIKESQSIEEFENKDETEDVDSFEQFVSSKFHDNNFFTIPNFDDGDDYKHDSDNESSDNKVKQDFSSPSYNSFSSYFPNEPSYNYKEDSDPFKSSFFDFDTELTTPKNDYFDKKFQQISTSIIKHLDSIKAKSPPPKISNVTKITQENVGLERLNNNTPSNKSSVYLKNTKEIRLLDNAGEGSANKELSDVQGTSIYYEMSVLSTETYAINHSNDDDCDNDTTAVETTASTSPQEELGAIKATQPTFDIETSKSFNPQSSEILSTISSSFFPISSIQPVYNSLNVVPISTQNYLPTQTYVPTTERTTRVFSSSFTRNRNYSKRLNLSGTKTSPNSVTIKTDSPVNTVRPSQRKFHNTTPKTKPIWLSPRRNITRIHSRPTNPTTIYSEHFDIKNKFTTSKTRPPLKTTLTTVPSAEIDPVLQSDIGGIRKVVHSQSISDNTIPSLRKRGSSRFTTSTATSAERETDLSELEIPSTAWALAGLISPPSLPSTVVNATENELQKVGEVLDKKETTVSSTTTTTVSPISNDIITKKVTDVDQNKLPWQPANSPTEPSPDQVTTSTEAKYEKLPAESNISEKNVEPVTMEAAKDNLIDSKTKFKDVKPLWVPATVMDITTAKYKKENEKIQPVDSTKSTSFESITKLPADVTTPQHETVAGSEVNQTIIEKKPEVTTEKFDITTIRFSYVPTEAAEATTEPDTFEIETTTPTWHVVLPTRTKLTTIKDGPITTYRPKYMTTTDMEEITTIFPDTTPVLEVSSQIIANVTEKLPETTTVMQTTTEEEPGYPITEIFTTEAPTPAPTLTPTTSTSTTTTQQTTSTTKIEPTTITVPTTEPMEDTTTIVVQLVTEINTEKVTIITQAPVTTELQTDTTETDCTSEENSDSNEIIHEPKTTEESSVEETTTTKNSQAEIVETTSRIPPTTQTTYNPTTTRLTTTGPIVRVETTTESASVIESTTNEVTSDENDGEVTTQAVDDSGETTTYVDMTTEASSQVLPDEAGSGAAVAIAVSTIGVIALVLLIGLLLVVRRRGRRGIYAQRCTPVSLDAYSLDSVSVGHRKGNHRLRASKRSYGNPAYDDEVTSHPMQFPALANFALDVDSMTAEFAEIPSVSVRPEEVPSGCEDKNRYSNVLPLPETRVPLRRIGNDPTSEYINANYVTGPGNIRNYYILAQAPLGNTVFDFWRMVWEQNSRLIVMLTEYMENGVEKCYEYLPPSEISDNKRTFGEFQILLKKREQRDKYAISTVQIINLTTRTWREVTHLWYFWPAKGVPDDYDSIIDFLFEMRSYMKVAQTGKEYDEEGVEVIYGDQNRSSFNNLSKFRDDNSSGNGVNVYSPAKAEEQMRKGYGNNGTLSRMKAASEVEGIRPCIVTCASGAGRSAAVCALDICARALHSGAADVPRTVRHLRTQRPHSLSNRHHYMFVYKVLSEYGNKVMGGGDTI